MLGKLSWRRCLGWGKDASKNIRSLVWALRPGCGALGLALTSPSVSCLQELHALPPSGGIH